MSKAIIENTNPVGNVQLVEQLEIHLAALIEQWDEEIAKIDIPWWKLWARKANLTTVTNFLMRSLDEFIQIVDEHLDLGPDKKATVLDTVGRLYDHVIVGILPVWLKPFASSVKDYIVNTLVSSAIDWIVEKYRNGQWREELVPEGE